MTRPNSCCSKPFWVTVKSIIVVFADNYGENEGFGSLQVINIKKFLLKSMSVPPIFIIPLVFFQITCFYKTGSNNGST
jgi:hypothetical protein